VNENEHLTDRLAELGRHPIPPAVAAQHLAGIDAAGVPASGARGRRLSAVAVAAAAVAVLGVTGVAAAALGSGGSRPTTVMAEEGEGVEGTQAEATEPVETPPVETPPVETPDPAVEELSGTEGGAVGDVVAEAARIAREVRRAAGCVGPPPWAGTPPAGATEEQRAASRAAEAQAFAALRAACPDDGDQGEASTGRPPGVPPAQAGPPARIADDPCVGPPPWAGIPPAGATEEERAASRAAEAQAFAALRAACPDGDDS